MAAPTPSTADLFAHAYSTYQTAVAQAEESGSWDALPAEVQSAFQEARTSLSDCAERGHAKARFILGELAEEGRGEAVSHARALEHYEKAALQGDPDAQLAYADKLEEGEGTEQDLSRAFEFYERAALNGIAEAQVRGRAGLRGEGKGGGGGQSLPPPPPAKDSLGNCYKRGSGTVQDLDRAFFWCAMDDFFAGLVSTAAPPPTSQPNVTPTSQVLQERPSGRPGRRVQPRPCVRRGRRVCAVARFRL